MDKKEKDNKEFYKITRRKFLKDAGIAAGGVVVGGSVLMASCTEGTETTVTKTVTQPTTVTKTVGEGDVITVTKTVGEGTEPYLEPEETHLQMINPMGYGGEPSAVDVKDGKIVRIRPLHYNEVYTQEELTPMHWKVEAHGKSFEPLGKASTGYLINTYKKRIYSPNRILYPLKRVDWEPGGDPDKINSQNRGKSKFKRISWDEATEIVASEIKRIHDKYSPYAVMTSGEYIHGESKNIHHHGGCHTRLLKQVGGYTREVRPPGSVSSFYWGAKHVWGNMADGIYDPTPTLLDLATNTDAIISFGGDYETWSGCKDTNMSRAMYWLFKEVGVKYVSVDPRLCYSAGVFADKWVPLIPNTDGALLLAVMYTWIEEDTFDKDYLDTHAVGFDEFKAYVVGDEDGIPKTPSWASKICGLPTWTIKALARFWASNTTTTNLSWAGMRAPYCHEFARLIACAMGMQSLGKPGVHNSFKGEAPAKAGFINVMAAMRAVGLESVPQQLPKGAFAEGILSPPLNYNALGSWVRPTSSQFNKWEYPIPADEGGSEIHMLWSEHVCNTACYSSGFRYMEALRSPKIECFVVQHQWLENDCLLADIIFPVSTAFEQTDIVAAIASHAYNSMILHDKTIENFGEGKSDYELVGEVAKKLEAYGGEYADAYNKYTGGLTEEDLLKLAYDTSGVTDRISWNKFKERKLYTLPVDPDWQKQKSGIIDFYNDPEKNPLGTPSGKLEYYCQESLTHSPKIMKGGLFPNILPVDLLLKDGHMMKA